MLQENPRPDDQTVRTRGNLHVAWKTGTSWGFRDAWTAGIFGHYVLVVWVGNFDSSSNPAFVGIQSAAPLFFRIFDALHSAEPTMSDLTLRPPQGVTQVAVCAASGDLPNAECPQTALTWFIPRQVADPDQRRASPDLVRHPHGRGSLPAVRSRIRALRGV
jgi:penicillin-binding protein 1C